MVKVGIVGNEAAKFTPVGEARAREIIRKILAPEPCILISGGCHLGGIDIWAEEIADELGREKIIFLPKERNWAKGYKPRNIQIATQSDVVHNIVVDVLPGGFKGMRHPMCYHCNSTDHVKSGGCWTAARAKKKYLHIIQNGD